MTNFADLVALLKADDAIVCCETGELAAEISKALSNTPAIQERTQRAFNALHVHSGATRRTVELVETLYQA